MNVRRAVKVAAAGMLVAVAGCAASGPAATAARSPGMHAYAAQYLAIARPANRQLDRSEDAYTENAHHDLAAARAALRAQAATERQFDRRLAAIPFPARIAAIARAMIAANTARISLALEQARASSVAALLAFTARHKAADAAVEVQARLIRRELGLPPPSTS